MSNKFILLGKCLNVNPRPSLVIIPLHLGTPCGNYKEKSIMLVGETGSGKSTFVDGIINYIMGVNFEDPFRLTMVTLEEDKKNNSNQVSQLQVLF